LKNSCIFQLRGILSSATAWSSSFYDRKSECGLGFAAVVGKKFDSTFGLELDHLSGIGIENRVISRAIGL